VRYEGWMDERLAVVTGGAGGLGRLVSRALAARGLTVVVADTDAEAAARALDELRRQGRRGVFVETDASNAGSVRRLMAQVAGLGTLSVLVNNAGGWLPGPQYPGDSQDPADSAWRRSLDLNLVMPMLACQLALPLMTVAHGGTHSSGEHVPTGGGIVNVSSSGGWGAEPYGSPEYGAAKAGLIRFSTAVSDWADRFGVRVNCVVPHWIGLDRAVEQFNRLTEEEQRRSGGLVDPDVVAGTVATLALDQASNGRVVVLRSGRDPYDVDPGSADPYA
jgi:NAD(P)-dependent dehydrogenase (short-subunit alcohol dehydrogenase family)